MVRISPSSERMIPDAGAAAAGADRLDLHHRGERRLGDRLHRDQVLQVRRCRCRSGPRRRCRSGCRLPRSRRAAPTPANPAPAPRTSAAVEDAEAATAAPVRPSAIGGRRGPAAGSRTATAAASAGGRGCWYGRAAARCRAVRGVLLAWRLLRRPGEAGLLSAAAAAAGAGGTARPGCGVPGRIEVPASSSRGAGRSWRSSWHRAAGTVKRERRSAPCRAAGASSGCRRRAVIEASTVPECRSATCRTIESPRPEPGIDRDSCER